ncbi:sirohydrochlorin cobaltochelatase [uncultured Desulfovibrio sp.]|uniref:sirohydrochlorin cobaltochelatase n=1 Tax=uncultured Desulfovibrio sp. TaxID=167968 RepID=UPI002637761B|nr:sirohydrochlorin cobaltochelatase [uncultured Desulfovibrio sp.]
MSCILRKFPRFMPLFLLLLALMATSAQTAERKAPKEGVLLVAFGTSVPEALPSFKAVDASFKAAFPDSPVVWAYTSQIIRRKLAKQGRPVGGISDGLAELAKDGVKLVRVQSLHVMPGEEFTELERAVLLDLQKHPGRFEALYLGRPLLESHKDALRVSKAVLADMDTRRKGEAVVLMGHGQAHGRADLAFEGARASFKESDPLVFMATVEGARGFDDLLAELSTRKVKKVWLQPLMVVAGDHARNDLAGDEEDSWASKLKAAGFQVQTNLKGLGQVPGVCDVFVAHAKENVDDLTKEPRKQ